MDAQVPLNIKLLKGRNWAALSKRFNSSSPTILFLISAFFTPYPTLVFSRHLFIHRLFKVFPKCLEYPVLGLHIYLYFECLIFDFQDHSGFKFCLFFLHLNLHMLLLVHQKAAVFSVWNIYVVYLNSAVEAGHINLILMSWLVGTVIISPNDRSPHSAPRYIQVRIWDSSKMFQTNKLCPKC